LSPRTTVRDSATTAGSAFTPCSIFRRCRVTEPAIAMRDEQPPASLSSGGVPTGIIGARRAWTVAMVSPLSMPLQVDGGDVDVAVGEWRWMTIGGTPSRALDGVGAPELVWREAPTDTSRRGGPAQVARAAAPDHGWPRVGPLMTEKSGATGSWTWSSSHGRSSRQPHTSVPGLRGGVRPCDAARAARRGGDRDRLRPARALGAKPCAPQNDYRAAERAAARMTAMLSSTFGGSAE
jgi:hypothetical protein